MVRMLIQCSKINMIGQNSKDYELLEKWTKDFDCQGYKTCEIGVREGLGSKIIMDNVKNNYIHVGVDPYGNLKYQHYDDGPAYTADYTDQMRDTMLNDFKSYRNQGKFTLCNMTDTQFMNDSEHRHSTFALVHFDGPHMTKDVMTEAVWFANRSAKGTRFVFDDYPKYNMSIVAKCLELYGFLITDKGENKCLMTKQK